MTSINCTLVCAHHFNNHGYRTYWQVQSKFHHTFVFFSVTSTSLSQTCSTVRCRGLTENFPSVTVSSYGSYSIPFNSSFLQNLLYPVFSSLSASSCGLLPLCCSITYQTILGYLSSPILTSCPYHLNCAKSVISLMFCYICSKVKR